MKTDAVPVGTSILGRVLNAQGEPIDRKGPVEQASRLPLSTPEALAKTANTSSSLLETGIKVIDLMAPIAAGSLVGLIAGYGLGKEVVAEEIMYHLLTKRQGVAVIAGMRETTYAASSLYEMVREIEVEDRMVMLFEQTTEESSIRKRLLQGATTIAAHFSDEGREVLLVLDSQLIHSKELISLQRFANARGITTLLFVPVNDLHQPTDQALLKTLDVQLWFSQERAKQGLWPAVDPLASRSRVLESNAVTGEHRQVTQCVSALLERYYQLRENANFLNSAEEQQTLKRGERVDLFFSQPFVVAEAFTEIPGTSLTREETITSFRDLLEGRYDDTPMQAFKFVGQIELP